MPDSMFAITVDTICSTLVLPNAELTVERAQLHFIIHPDVGMADGHSIPKSTHTSECRFCPHSCFCGCSILLPFIYTFNRGRDHLEDLGMNGMVEILHTTARRNSEV
jgi:hypothetical protein